MIEFVRFPAIAWWLTWFTSSSLLIFQEALTSGRSDVSCSSRMVLKADPPDEDSNRR